ncbi:MAG: hypothetical protein EA376_13475 [Phycisphaeraceae bacterium]|nr:MAG: hypothetical protein EA376_13475 [Phycisphaeraceae bacterium]
MDLDDITDGLRRPGAIPDHSGPVETLQTHISVVFLAGEIVYKLKKPVDMGFLDFSTPERRKHFCEEEVRLNRRLAPHVYHGVSRIVRTESGELRVDGAGETIDHVVRMRRLPAAGMLDELLDGPGVAESTIEELVQILARFHAKAPAGPGVDEHGAPEAVREAVVGNLDGCRSFAAAPGEEAERGVRTISTQALDHLRAWIEDAIAERSELLRRRVEAGRVREGHGDLHAGNICITDDGIVVFDCIEFSKPLRCGDVARELAYLAMDLRARGWLDLADDLVRMYGERTGDPELSELQPLFQAHYAAVRGHVTSLRAVDSSIGEREREKSATSARRSLLQAVGLTLAPSLVLMCGLPATGKSWLSERIALALGAERIRSDVVRKEMAGPESAAAGRGGVDQGMYTPERIRRVYDAMLERAGETLERGRAVVIDATFSSARERARFLRQAERLGRRGLVVHVQCPEAVVRERLAQREGDAAEPSDADLRVYQSARERFEPPAEVAAEHLIEVDGRSPAEDGAEATLLRLLG